MTATPERTKAPTVTVVCVPPAGVYCKWQGMSRTVSLTPLGMGLFARAEVVCECGYIPLTPPSDSPEWWGSLTAELAGRVGA